MPGMAEIEMTLGWVIAYIEDPAAAAAFYERTFGLRKDFVVPGDYAQMDTGPTKLGFATYALARGNFDGGVRLAVVPQVLPNGNAADGRPVADRAVGPGGVVVDEPDRQRRGPGGA